MVIRLIFKEDFAKSSEDCKIFEEEPPDYRSQTPPLISTKTNSTMENQT